MPRVARNYQHQNFSYLLTPTKETPQPQEPKKKPAVEVSDARRRRDRLMSDRRMRYVLHRGRLHDRDCALAAKIRDEEFDMCADLPDITHVCLSCYRSALVRRAFDDHMSKYVPLAVRILDRLGATNRDLEMLFWEKNARVIAIDKEELHLQIDEELWRVCVTENGCFLYHNNYTRLSPEARFFEQGYHRQYPHALPFYQAVRTMYQYTWERHLRGERMKELRRTLATVDNAVRLRRPSLLYRYYRAVDIDGYLQRRIACEKLPVALLKKQGESPFERLTLRVRRRDDALMHKLAADAKERCVRNLCETYAPACLGLK